MTQKSKEETINPVFTQQSIAMRYKFHQLPKCTTLIVFTFLMEECPSLPHIAQHFQEEALH